MKGGFYSLALKHFLYFLNKYTPKKSNTVANSFLKKTYQHFIIVSLLGDPLKSSRTIELLFILCVL